MSIKIRIPVALRAYANQQSEVEVDAATVSDALAQLAARHAELRKHLFSDSGQVRNFVRVFVNDADVDLHSNGQHPLRAGDVLTIVPSIAGGLIELRSAPPAPKLQPVVPGRVKLTNEEVKRYSRHLILPEVGVEGQERIKAAKVLLIGSGGLGSPLALYLAAAGVGTIGMVDFDVVDFSNLQRQVIHFTTDVGKPKLTSAGEKIKALNPHLNFIPYETRLTADNALDIIKDYDLVIDGTDNYPTRYLVNDACVMLKKPNVYGSIFRFEGQCSVFAPHLGGPCYRCLYPEPPPPGLVPSCAEGGVLGVICGVVGNIQANEGIKLILGRGEPLIGRLLLFDAMEMKFRELKLRRDPNCPLCGNHPTITKLIDYEQFCGLSRGETEKPAETASIEITVEELKALLDRGEKPLIIDVRESDEWEICHLDGAQLIPLSQLQQRWAELKDEKRTIVLHCHHGTRSLRALQFLRQQGLAAPMKNLKGGIDAWADAFDPDMARY
jgi:adenylyltransferase/sulfurtransferase